MTLAASPVPHPTFGGKYAIIAASSSGATQVVAPVMGYAIVCVCYNYMANGTVNVKFQSYNAGTSTSTDISGLGYYAVNTGKVVPFSAVGWFKTNIGEALNINLSANVAVGGELVFCLM